MTDAHGKKTALFCLFALVPAGLYFLFFVFYRLAFQGLLMDAGDHGFWANEVIYRFLAFFRPDLPISHLSPSFHSFFCVKPFANPRAYLPLMTCFFTGTPIIYAVVPFVLMLGQTTTAVVMPFALMAFAAAVIVYDVCRQWFGRAAACAVFVLMCTDSFFIRLVRVGPQSESVLQVFLLWLGLWMFVRARRSAKGGGLFWAAGVWGFALYTKLMFAAYIAGALFVAVLFCRDKELRNVWAFVFRTRFRAAAAVAAFLLGSAPLVVYNFATGFSSVGRAIACMGGAQTKAGNTSMLNFAANMRVRASELIDILSRNFEEVDFISLGGAQTAALWIAAVILVFVLAHSVFAARRQAQARIMLRFFVFYMVVLLAAAFSPGSFKSNHLGVLVPFLYIAQARFLVLAWNRRPLSLALAGLLLFDWGANLRGTLAFAAGLEPGRLNSVYDFSHDWNAVTDYMLESDEVDNILIDRDFMGFFYGKLVFLKTYHAHDTVFGARYPRFKDVRGRSGDIFAGERFIYVLTCTNVEENMEAGMDRIREMFPGLVIRRDENLPGAGIVRLYRFDISRARRERLKNYLLDSFEPLMFLKERKGCAMDFGDIAAAPPAAQELFVIDGESRGKATRPDGEGRQ